ncbi:MAG: epoxyqueuosine reductase QueH [Oscillospiraceae bacterium]|nr:epoxyqueuosine reductase QueH [Oscillospiraceae bacterium]
MEKRNYQKELDGIISALDRRPTLLLQGCCGPCSSYVLEYITQYFDVTLLFYNPNIRPEAEYDRRLATLRQLLETMPLAHPPTLREPGWQGPVFEQAVRGMESLPEGGARCTVCFRLRLEETAKQAAAGGFDYFGTTLTVSPHKNAPLINQIGEALGQQYGVRWLPSDFKKRNGYLRSILLSKEYGLYRQEYCGCGYPEGPKEDDAAQKMADFGENVKIGIA